MSGKVLLVDDDPKLLRLVEHELAEEAIETVATTTGKEALRRVKEEEPAAVILDLLLPDIPGKDLLVRFRRDHPELPIVVLTSQGAVVDVVECLRLGAVDYIQKPFDRTRLVTSVRNALTQGILRARVESLAHERKGEGFAAILGRSGSLKAALDLLVRAAKSDVTVLLEGESGTGKEVAARTMHGEGTRWTGPLVAVNCGAIPEGLIESELFGHEKGAFTGAIGTRAGRFEQANGGTIFLDEIGELRLDLQVRLLRVLQERVVQRVGGVKGRAIDVRVVAATSRDLKSEVARGTFREDLYYRLAVFPVRLPPLRDRDGDVMLLAEAFVKRFADVHRREVRGITAEARRALEAYGWPGNVRELQNVIERATILEDGPLITLGSLPDEVVCALDAERPHGVATAGPIGGGAPAPVPAGAAVASVSGPSFLGAGSLAPGAAAGMGAGAGGGSILGGADPARGGFGGAGGAAGSFGAPGAAPAAGPAPASSGAPTSHVSGRMASPSHVGPPAGETGLPHGHSRGADAGATGEILPFDEQERRIILRALESTSWNVKEAASRLRISRATIYRKIERYGLDAGRPGMASAPAVAR